MKKFGLLVLAVMVSCVSFAQGPSPKQAFEQLKKLVGTWEQSGQGGSFKVVYKLTGGGSTLVETQFAGQPHEMVSMYHMYGDKLIMTHYCAAGNQPTLIYKPGKEGKVLVFDFLRGSNMKATDMHIHAARIHLLSANEIKSDWIGWSDNKQAGEPTVFNLKRVSS